MIPSGATNWRKGSVPSAIFFGCSHPDAAARPLSGTARRGGLAAANKLLKYYAFPKVNALFGYENGA
jgi:hypothetical protein